MARDYIPKKEAASSMLASSVVRSVLFKDQPNRRASPPPLPTEASNPLSGLSAQEFVFTYAKTLDPHDTQGGVAKSFPRKKYLETAIDLWLQEPRLAIPKSRQMMVSWLFITLYLWLAMTTPGALVFFISKKEDDAGYGNEELSLLSRARFVYNHLPTEFQIPHTEGRAPPILGFPKQHSIIQACSQEANAVRMYTATGILWDEAAFHEKAYDTFAAAKPTIDGGGRITVVSTPNGNRVQNGGFNLFYACVFDKDISSAA